MEDFVGLIYKSITFKPQMEDFIVIKPLFVGDVQLLPSLHQPIIPWLFCRCAQAFLAAKSPQASSRAGTTGLRSSIHGDAHVTSMALRIQWAT